MLHQLSPIPRLHQPTIRHFLWSPDSQSIVMSHGPSLWLCNARFQFIRHLVDIEYDDYGRPRDRWQGKFIDDIMPIAWTPDNQAVIVLETWCKEEFLSIWPTHWFIKRIAMDGTTPPQTIAEYKDVIGVRVQPNRDTSQLLVQVPSGTQANPITQFQTLHTKVAFKYQYPVNRVEWVVDDQYILTQSMQKYLGSKNYQIIYECPNHIRLWDTKKGKARFDFPTRSDDDRVFISPDKRLACIISLDATAWVWDLATRKILFGLEGFTHPIPHTFDQVYYENVPSSRGLLGDVQWSPDGTRLAGLRRDLTFFVWGATNGRQISQFPALPDSLIWLWSPDGRFVVATSFEEDIITVYQVTTGAVVNQLVSMKMRDPLSETLVWRPDGQQLLLMADFSNELKIWDTAASDPAQWTLALDYYRADEA